MGDSNEYVPPKVWEWDAENGGIWGSTNRPIAGPTHDAELPVGDRPLQLYSKGTSNGIKVAIMLEELAELGKAGAAYDKHPIEITEGEQFGSGFVKVNPNSKIPALMDYSTEPPTRIFESSAILLYLAKKFDAYLPSDLAAQAECFSWLFWQVGSAPFLGGGFGHFYIFAPEKLEYPINRYAMEVKRQFDVLNRHLAENEFMCGDEYTIADMGIWPWMYTMIFNGGYNAAEFLQLDTYTNVARWAAQVEERPAVKRGYLTKKTNAIKVKY